MIRRKIFEEEHDTFRDSVRRFFKREIQPYVDGWRDAGIVDREAYKKAGDQGYLLMWADERYGGPGISDFRFEQVLIEENVRFGDLSFFMSLHSRLVGPYIGLLGTEEQKGRILPACISGDTILAVAMTESNAGSDLAGTRTVAKRRGDSWILSGSKTYISNGINADVIVVAARTEKSGSHGFGLFLVERGMPGFTRGPLLKKMGLKAQDTAELFFDQVEIPASNVLGDPAKGFRNLMRMLADERLLSATANIAHAQEAFDITLRYVQDRSAFGKPIGAFQNTRFKLAEMRTRLDVGQTFVDQCVLDLNADELTAEIAAEAKLFTSELEGWVMDECLQLHGGAGYMDEFRICRMYADARVSRIYAGTSEIMKEIISRGLGLH